MGAEKPSTPPSPSPPSGASAYFSTCRCCHHLQHATPPTNITFSFWGKLIKNKAKMQCQYVGGVLLSRAVPFARWLQARSSSTRLFIKGLSSHINEPVLKDAFGKYGEIIEVRVICHSESGISKGYGFVQFTSETAASTALKEMMGASIDGRNICVDYANKDPNREKME